MTRDEQVTLALRILRPEDREQCRADILQIIGIVDDETTEEITPALLASKLTKAKVEALRHAIGKVREKHNALPEEIKDVVFIDVQKHLEACDAILKQPSKPLRNPAVRQRLAAAGAQDLLFDYGVWPVVTRGGSWDKLAAVLFGDRTANMVPYLRQLKELNDIW